MLRMAKRRRSSGERLEIRLDEISTVSSLNTNRHVANRPSVLSSNDGGVRYHEAPNEQWKSQPFAVSSEKRALAGIGGSNVQTDHRLRRAYRDGDGQSCWLPGITP
jgi:hypothetical protein